MITAIQIAAALAVFFLGMSCYEVRHFRVKKYRLSVEKQKGKPVKLLFLSDLHNCAYGKENEALLRAAAQEAPDLVLIGGDMFTAKDAVRAGRTEAFLRALSETYPCFYALGNHEQRCAADPEHGGEWYARFQAFLQDCGIVLLDNTSCSVEIKGNRIDLYGLTLEKAYYRAVHAPKLMREDITEKIGRAKPEGYAILLAHHPAYAKAYAAWGADLVLSGHYHGGMVRIGRQGVISPAVRLFPRWSYGRFRENNTDMIVSGGLGQHTIPLRLWNPPELLVIEINTNE